MNPLRRTALQNVTLRLAASALAFAACGPDDDPDPEPTVAEGIYGRFGDPVQFATTEQLETFQRGHDAVARVFTPEDGLGPLFNLASCGGCHERPVFGGGAARYRDFYLSASKLPDGSYIAPPMAGIEHAYGIGDGVATRPDVTGNWNIQARRNPIPFFGVGLLAELSEESILANADPDDLDGDGISGRPNYDNGFVGRFGRKAQTVSIEGFIRGPLNNHLGITSDPLTEEQRAALPVDSSTAARDAAVFGTRSGALTAEFETRRQAQAAPPSEPLTDTDGVPDPELSSQDLFDIVSFSMLLAAPTPSPATPESEHGAQLFEEVGCASCHVPALEGPRGLIPAYTDLLLHDMGEELADGIEMGDATGSEFRTQPLWGVVAVGPYLHDGRADTLDGAIRWHGGEGERSRDAYVALSELDQLDVVAFLESLGGLEDHSDGLIHPNAPIAPVGTLGGPIAALDASAESMFLEGRRLFDRDTHIADGLGPVFNGDSCRACHFEVTPAGAGPIDVNVMRHATYNAATDSYLAPPAGTILHKLTLFDALRVEPAASINVFEPRQTPHTFGLGLIDGIAEDTIRANADPDDADGDGISGRVAITPGDRVGRFGWKAQVPTVREFVRDAMGAEQGLTSPDEPGQTFGARNDFDDVDDPELSVEDLDAVEFYLASLAPPPPGAGDAHGEELFETVGCASCHIPALDGADGPVPLYSDLLLHDVAADGVLGIPDGTATAREFRTAPLWGLSVTAPYMHDGYATTIEAAIAAHHAEGEASAAAFAALADSDRSALLAFLHSL
ncbi:MAG: hypothetical protein H6700_05975 [Myxococcales bacterium]|nr:hypothetical protein [Myxococcales bacterium]MCB9519396.1 hypothetical protein [Myxococcales bacterium]MCB9531295.1 hypothetical protein [Myxococcales bacterium]